MMAAASVCETAQDAPLSTPGPGATSHVTFTGSSSTSLAEADTVRAVPSLAAAVGGAVTLGGSLTALTVIVTVAGCDVARPSSAVNVNESDPLKFGAGSYV